MNKGGLCELCGRCVDQLTRHHLIPRTRHANKRNKRDFDRKEIKGRIALICRSCHNQIHALIPEKSLEREFNTLAALAAHPEMMRFIAWIRTKPAGFRASHQAARNRGMAALRDT